MIKKKFDSSVLEISNCPTARHRLNHVGQVEFHFWLPARQSENLVHILSIMSILTY